MKKLIIAIAVILTSCNSPVKNSSTNVDTPVVATPISTLQPTEAAPTNWTYEESTDKMTDKVIKYASCNSSNSINFSAPYDGGSTLKIMVRKMNGKNEVILSISQGQFMSSYSSSLKIKFDDEPVKNYDFSEPADGSSDYIFPSPAASLIAKLKKAKKVKIQPAFYQEGQTVFEFNVAGLQWQ